MMGYGGPGTEKVEREVRELLPGIETLRMDRDTTTRRGTHSRLLHLFRSRKAAVLVGTQMIAKGLDFPSVTLVGVVNADVGLHVPDWRAAERTFQVLMQVSGRAGRGDIPGHVIVQTYMPNNYAVAHAAAGRFATFVEEELRFRNELHYPPFAFAANLLITGRSNKTAEQRAVRIGRAFHETAVKCDFGDGVLGPAPCPIAKLRGVFRWHLFVRHHSRPKLHQILNDAISTLNPADRAALTVDVDPMSVL
jgi:primosomal protein N' (replication factor Y)